MSHDSKRHPLLIAALDFGTLDTSRSRVPPPLVSLHSLLDSWTGIGHVVVGMERQGFKTSLRSIAADDWVCSFQGDPSLASSGFGSGPPPWLATQRAAWAAVKKPKP